MIRVNIKICQILILVSIWSSCNEKIIKDDHEDGHEHSELESDKIILTQKQFDASEYQIGGFEKIEFNNKLMVTGLIHLPEKNMAMVTSYLGGRVDNMELIHGQWVRKEHKLFSISNPELIKIQQEYLETKGVLTYLQEEAARLKTLADENISARKNFLKAESEYNIAQTKYGALSQELSLLGISPDAVRPLALISSLDVVAPISGYISEINVVKGSYLKPTEIAMEISNTNHLHMELKVLERDVRKVKNEQKVRFSLQDNSEKFYHATIYLIERKVNEDRMVNVHCHLEDEDNNIFIPGMYVNAEIILDQRSAQGLPEESVVSLEDHYYVMLKEEESALSFHRREVTIGANENGYIEILNAASFDVNDQFLTRGAYYLIAEEGTGGHTH